MKNPEPNLPFLLGQAPASIVEPKSVATNGTNPVGTGPFTVGAWAKGSSITLNKWPEYRNAAAIKLNKVVIRFISDPSAQVASLLSGDVDAFPRVAAARSRLEKLGAEGHIADVTRREEWDANAAGADEGGAAADLRAAGADPAPELAGGPGARPDQPNRTEPSCPFAARKERERCSCDRKRARPARREQRASSLVVKPLR